MYCKNCGSKFSNNSKFCSSCGIKIQCFKQNDKLVKILGICAGVLCILSFVILLSGVVIGVGSGYDNPSSTFDFTPYGISFSIMNIINILLIIFIIILKKSKRRE